MTKQVKQFIFWVGALVIGAVLSASVYEGVAQDKIQGMNVINGFQELMFMIIGWLIKILPIGIVAFTAQLIKEMSTDIAMDSIGKYVAVVLCGNLIQFFIVLPLFLFARGLNPLTQTNKDLKNEVEVSA